MSKESSSLPEKDTSYPEFEEGPNQSVPETDEPKPELADERPYPPVDDLGWPWDSDD